MYFDLLAYIMLPTLSVEVSGISGKRSLRPNLRIVTVKETLLSKLDTRKLEKNGTLQSRGCSSSGETHNIYCIFDSQREPAEGQNALSRASLCIYCSSIRQDLIAGAFSLAAFKSRTDKERLKRRCRLVCFLASPHEAPW